MWRLTLILFFILRKCPDVTEPLLDATSLSLSPSTLSLSRSMSESVSSLCLVVGNTITGGIL